MNSAALNDLHGKYFTLRFVNVLKQFWRKGNTYHQATAKIHNNLLYLYKCSAKYTLGSGEVFFAHSGDIVIAPKNSTYHVSFFDFAPQTGCTIGINYHMYDEMDNEILIAKEPLLFQPAHNAQIQNFNELFERINDNATTDIPHIAQIYSDLYRIFSLMIAENDRKSFDYSDFSSISKAIMHLRSDDAYTMSIEEIAQECGVSDSYLRRQFKRYSGMSPRKYVRERKLLAAKNFLRYSDMSIDEIAYRLNFTDSSYFCKIFREETAMTPVQYRNLYFPAEY